MALFRRGEKNATPDGVAPDETAPVPDEPEAEAEAGDTAATAFHLVTNACIAVTESATVAAGCGHPPSEPASVGSFVNAAQKAALAATV